MTTYKAAPYLIGLKYYKITPIKSLKQCLIPGSDKLIKCYLCPKSDHFSPPPTMSHLDSCHSETLQPPPGPARSFSDLTSCYFSCQLNSSHVGGPGTLNLWFPLPRTPPPSLKAASFPSFGAPHLGHLVNKAFPGHPT